MTEDWRSLQKRELYGVYSLQNDSRAIHSTRRGADYVARMGQSEGTYRVLVSKTVGEENT